MTNLRFDQTGDPWHDWGLCELYDSFLLVDGVKCSTIESGGFTIKTELSEDEFSQKVASQINSAERWNLLHPRYPEGKKIPRCMPRIIKGRRVTGEDYDPEVTKQEWEESGCTGMKPTKARKTCKRMPTVPITTSSFDKLMTESDNEDNHCIRYYIRQSYKRSSENVTQSVNPLVAKHHSNSKVRGASYTNSAPTASALFVLACYCSSICPYIPFYREDGSTAIVLLPDGNSLPILHKLWRHIRYGGVLIHPDESNGNMSSNIPFNVNGRNAHLLVLLDQLQDSLVLHEINDDLFSDDDLVTLANWIAIEINSGTNIRIGIIKRILVPGNLFSLLKPIPSPQWSKTEASEISFIKDCFVKLHFKYFPFQEKMAEALFEMRVNNYDCWKSLTDIAYMAYKNSKDDSLDSWAVKLLPYFYEHFAKEIIKMRDDELTACKKIGDLVGSVFSRDVTLLSRLHNVSSPAELRSSLELIAFRLFKLSAGNETNGSWHISSEEFTQILEMAETDAWSLAAQTICTFACLKAFNQNLSDTQTKKE